MSICALVTDEKKVEKKEFKRSATVVENTHVPLVIFTRGIIQCE